MGQRPHSHRGTRRERTVKRLNNRRAAALLAASALLVAACGGDGDDTEAAEATSTTAAAPTTTESTLPPEPTTTLPARDEAAILTLADGEVVTIPRTRLDELHDPLVDDLDLATRAFDGPPSPSLRASMLTELILFEMFGRRIERDGLRFEPVDRLSPLYTDLIDGLAGLYPDEPDAREIAAEKYDAIPYLQFLGESRSRTNAVIEALIDEASTSTVPCVSHILLETEQEALDVIAELVIGVDFAELAMERSTGPSGPNGGDLGCADPSGYVTNFRDAVISAEIDEVTGPVETQFGWHVLIVTGEEAAAPNLSLDVVLQNFIRDSLGDAEVDIDPSIGTWDGAASVVPAFNG